MFFSREARMPEDGGGLHEIQVRMFRAVSAVPGLAVKDIAGALGITSQHALYHLRALAAHAQKQRRQLDHVELHCMDAERMTFDDDSFDKVVAMYVMSVAPDPKRLLDEMRRVCRHDGDLYIVNHFRHANPVIGTLERVVARDVEQIGQPDDVIEVRVRNK